ncbi:uncharacterized protein [Euphorbia lathyris]|uniref:uncharacterized protein n=1 Tax=Euphorbia lathyris TaxID=212925 RepID=UPI0033141F50
MESRTQKEDKKKTVSKDEVIAKLKDDGDFDNLRLNIIRKLKDNEDLRNSIVSIVRQSVALNRAGAENMKPRQLSDTIYDEVGSELTSKLSDGVWGIIRSDDGMKNEITETVQSVYDKLAEPDKKEGGEPLVQDNHKADIKDGVMAPAVSEGGNLLNAELQKPPGFSFSPNHQNHQEELLLNMHSRGTMEEQNQGTNLVKDAMKADNVDSGAPPGFSAESEHEQPGDGSDEDPEVPPGFG